MDTVPSMFQQHMQHVFNVCFLIAALTLTIMVFRVKESKIKLWKALLIIGIVETIFLGALIANLSLQPYGDIDLSGELVFMWVNHFIISSVVCLSAHFGQILRRHLRRKK